jgi:rubredoxin
MAGLMAKELFVEVDTDTYPNIMSSCVAEQMSHTGSWLKEGVYKDVLESFNILNYRPQLTVNLVDQGQTLVPFNTGRVNFIASTIGNYWHLLLRLTPQSQSQEWPSLVYSGNIARLTRCLEGCLPAGGGGYAGGGGTVAALYADIMQSEQWTEQLPEEKMIFPDFALPYYEGFNRNGDRLWLGIYRRDELFPLPFLKDLCMLCLDTKIAQLYTTPWKSIVILGIAQGGRKAWDIVLGRHSINVRHSLCELSWQVEDVSADGLALKHYLVRQFDRDDVRTFGLCFAIQLDPKTTGFGLVLIRRHKGGQNRQRIHDRFEILYRSDFDARSDSFVLFRKEVEKEHLATYLKSLCKYFYECKAGEDMILHHVYRHREAAPSPGQSPAATGETSIYECSHCLTVYDPAIGDTEAGIPAGTAFHTVTAYNCPVCESDRSAFRRANPITPNPQSNGK